MDKWRVCYGRVKTLRQFSAWVELRCARNAKVDSSYT